MTSPTFPQFKPLELEDRPVLHERIWNDQPETSELTFTNLFIWRQRYGFQWSVYKDWLLIASVLPGRDPMGLPPLGPASRVEAVRLLLGWLKDEQGAADPRIERADIKLISEIPRNGDFLFEPARDQFDYIYQSGDLINLSGSRYHGKRNHIARFTQSHVYSYAGLDASHIIPCLKLAEAWCAFKRCEDELSLMDEWDAVKESLGHFQALGLVGGVILIEGKVEAFTLGELLNTQTAVVHVEKANPDIPGLYAVINREFCKNEWSGVPFINREQDLGEPGLRKAKLSYHPVRFVEKFTIRPAGR